LVPPSYPTWHVPTHQSADEDASDLDPIQQEFWGMITATGTFLSVEAGVINVLGWEPDNLIRKDLDAFCVTSSTGENGRDALSEGLAKASERNDGGFQAVSLTLQGKGNCVTDVIISGRARKIYWDVFTKISGKTSPSGRLSQIFSLYFLQLYCSGNLHVSEFVGTFARIEEQRMPYN
jgi:hypothetical protein